MIGGIARKLFGTVNERRLRAMQPKIDAINALEPELEKLTDGQLKARTQAFRDRLKEGETLDDILVEAFATVREASKRTIGLRHFDVQMLGGMVLHQGMISEMKTGEGKTLVCTLAAYLNAIEGKGVHVVTVNDYLARRDSAWMGKIHEFLGLTVGCIVHELDDSERQKMYACDITYATNNELGFDYLRDNMKFELNEMVQRPFNFAVVDEVDSILIDEARTPLIISGPVEDNSALYMRVDKFMPKLKKSDYEIDEKARTVSFSEEGAAHIEEMLAADGVIKEGESLYDIHNISVVHHMNQALRAHTLFTKDKDYIVKDNRVVIIDEFTGRMMEGRRYSEGLHQALEAKEGVPIQQENQTLASITFQNYFRLYPKLAGMTGTAMTEATEFMDIYKLDVVDIPTNVDVARIDEHDVIFRTEQEKFEAIVKEIVEANKKKQPVLVGTVSIEKSELLSKYLTKKNIKHQVLNARYHEKEAYIIAQAGRPGAVTIATNMAGRGTDIMLGGNPSMLAEEKAGTEADAGKRQSIIEKVTKEVAEDKKKVREAGGLYVIGTERHESRRIDNQLRGRSGRQGDPGRSRFYLSLEDDLMRIFGSERIEGVLHKLGLKDGESIEHPWMNKALEKAQGRVEARNYEIRKNLLKFDDVMNDQRKVIYNQRIEIMRATDVTDVVKDMKVEVIDKMVANAIPERSYAEQWSVDSLAKDVHRVLNIQLPIEKWAKEEGIEDKEIYKRILDASDATIANKEKLYGTAIMRDVEKRVLLFTFDQLWKDHLHMLDHLRQGINLRAYGQKDPLNEYKREAFAMFDVMLSSVKESVTTRIAHLEIQPSTVGSAINLSSKPKRMVESRVDPAEKATVDKETTGTVVKKATGPLDPTDPSTWGKVGRNDPCPCGSGKKFKHCHGVLT
ncbi:MAG: preprotein translocase subunit SecA [Proteobacteria bacterium]|nr:preprotein translocase subunit SecA [Pseudomonadota bacterium]